MGRIVRRPSPKCQHFMAAGLACHLQVMLKCTLQAQRSAHQCQHLASRRPRPPRRPPHDRPRGRAARARRRAGDGALRRCACSPRTCMRTHLTRGPAAVTADEIASIVDWRNHVGRGSSAVRVARDPARLERHPGAAGPRRACATRSARAAAMRAAWTPLRAARLRRRSFAPGRPRRHARRVAFNMAREFERNARALRVPAVVPGELQRHHGLSRRAPGSFTRSTSSAPRASSAPRDADGTPWAFPDFVIGGDSHTPMVNALGVLGWGVGGIDAEAALLGLAVHLPDSGSGRRAPARHAAARRIHHRPRAPRHAAAAQGARGRLRGRVLRGPRSRA